MIVPNKVVSLENSAMGQIAIILNEGPTPLALSALWERVARSFESIDQFMLAVDVLYVIGAIDLDDARGMVIYAG